MFNNVKKGYTFDDLLLVPGYSEIISRKHPNISSEITKGYKFDVPIVSSNMNTVTEKEMIKAMCDSGATAAIHRFIEPENLVFNHIKELLSLDNKYNKKFGISIGVDQNYYNCVFELLEKSNLINGIGYIIIDVAHGHHILMKNTIKEIKKRYNIPIIGGNICSERAALDLFEWGADSLKIGIGPGCFNKDTKVITNNGIKNIQDIEIGDKVLTHKNRYKKVLNVMNRIENKKLININGNKCTSNHEFYVINKKYRNNNIETFSEWISAEKLNNDYLLIKVENKLVEIIKSEEDFNGIVYDLEIEDDHSYNVDGIIVHNSACTTRTTTGFGFPQLSAINNIYNILYEKFKEDRPKLIADGGIKHTGDIVKAIAAGADFVMVGGMLAGMKETPGKVITKYGEKFKIYEGMASIDAQATFFNIEAEDIVPEGEAFEVKYKGSTYKNMKKIIGSIKTGLSYAGCNNITELQEFGRNPDNWVIVSNLGYIEGTPHGISLRH